MSIIVGGNLRRLRRRQGHSLERLAQLSGVSRAMLGQIETGKSAPTVNLLWKVEKPWVKTLVEAYHSPEVKAFVADKFKGSVIAAW